jgi:hypothetical protein
MEFVDTTLYFIAVGRKISTPRVLVVTPPIQIHKIKKFDKPYRILANGGARARAAAPRHEFPFDSRHDNIESHCGGPQGHTVGTNDNACD